METHLGNIWATRLSVFCLSTSSSSVLSLIRSSKLEEYCSNMRSMESMMLVFFPLVMLLNCHMERKTQLCPPSYRLTCENIQTCVYTCLKISSKVGLRSGSSLQACFMICITSTGASSSDMTGRHKGGGSLTLLIISVIIHINKKPTQAETLVQDLVYPVLSANCDLNC